MKLTKDTKKTYFCRLSLDKFFMKESIDSRKASFNLRVLRGSFTMHNTSF
jgi:hypothetical protein